MQNIWDKGLQADFNNMTKELGWLVWIYKREEDLTYEGQEDTNTDKEPYVPEIVFLQEIDSEHEMIASGQMNIGDVKFTFQSNSIAEEEAFVSPDEGETFYKILKLTKIRNQTTNAIMYIKAYGKKVPER